MKQCMFCRESVQDDALRCPHCTSILAPLPAASDVPALTSNSDGKVTYVVDEGLLRFAKFAGAVLTIFIVVGAFLYGFDLQKAAKEIQAAHEEAKDISQKIQADREEVVRLQKATAALADQARIDAESISKSSEQANGIVANMQSTNSVDSISRLVIVRISPALTPAQRSMLDKTLARESAAKDSEGDIRKKIASDILRAYSYYRAHGITRPAPAFEIAADRTLANAFWDGRKVVFGMGMISPPFGPYDSSIILHEATHPLFDLKFEGQSGSVSEHICDVMAVVIRGGDWTIGTVLGDGPNAKRQALRSLNSPGEAYASGILGKDPEVDSMEKFVNGSADNGNIHINVGILNKAAYLMSEGGSFRGVSISRGIGRERLGELYVTVIKKLPAKASLDFTQFRDLVIAAASPSFSQTELESIRQAFKAVGL